MPSCPVVDTHVHFLNHEKFRYPWVDEVPALGKSFLLEDYQRETEGMNISTMLFMQCDCEWSSSLDEVRWVADLAREEKRLRGIISYAPIEKGDGCRSFLEELSTIPLVRGVRRLIQSEPDLEFCVQPDFLRGLEVLTEFEMSFDICIYHVQLGSVLQMVERSPSVSFILDHIGKPDIKHGVMHPWGAQIKRLSEFPNVVCKISGMLTEADHENWTRDELKPYVDHVIDCFGFDRVVYGGDWPVSTMAGGYAAWMGALEWALEGCSEGDLRKFFSENAERVYRLG